MATTETLQYFNLTARGQFIRLAYIYGDIEFEDTRYEFSEWPAIKPDAPLGQLPVLTYDGTKFTQSLAMLRFVGGRAGLYPKVGTKCQLVVEDILATSDELWSNTPKEEERAEYIKAKVAAGLKHVENLVNSHSGADSKFVLGDTLSVADLFLHSYVTMFSSGFFDVFSADTFKNYETVMRIVNNVQEHPKFQKELNN